MGILNQYVDEETFKDYSFYKKINSSRINKYDKFDSEKFYNSINTSLQMYGFKDDYITSTFNDICKSGKYSLKPQQKFAGRIMNTFTESNGILIYHGLGSGKTQTSIVIGESFKYLSTDSTKIEGRPQSVIYVVVPAALQAQYFNEIQGVYKNNELQAASTQIIINGKTQHYLSKEQYNVIATHDPHKESHVTIVKTIIRTARTNIELVYNIVSHESFLNKLYDHNLNQGEYIKPYPGVSELFKDGLIIIDEAHKLVSESGSNYRRLLYALKYHSNLKTVLLSGTPIYDKPFEIGLLINLLKPRVPFPDGSLKFNELFIDDKITAKNMDIFKMLIQGYVSYFKGGNPNAYPYKRVIIMKHQMGEYQLTKYENQLARDMESDADTDLKAKTDLLSKIINKTDNNTDVISVYNVSRLYCNLVFPDLQTSNDKKIIDEYNGIIKFAQQTQRKKLIDLQIRELVNQSKTIESLKKFSVKFASIINILSTCKGTVFIYSNYVNYGVDALAAVLKNFGYTETKTGKPKQNSFFILKGDVSQSKEAETAKQTFNDISNLDGSQLKIILGTQTTMEGIDFKRVRQVHILDPWWNESRIDQVTARAIRLCSHDGLPENERVVDVYIHLITFTLSGRHLIGPKNKAVLANKKGLYKRSVEEFMYERSLEKSKLNTQFEIAIKESAIDCQINKNGNLVRLEEYYEQNGSMFRFYYKNPSSGVIYTHDRFPNNVNMDFILNHRSMNAGYSFNNGSLKSIIVPEDFDCGNGKNPVYSWETIKKNKMLENLALNNSVLKQVYSKNKSMISTYFDNLISTKRNPELIKKFKQMLKESKSVQDFKKVKEISEMINEGTQIDNLAEILDKVLTSKEINVIKF
jgi:hypothetical protein